MSISPNILAIDFEKHFTPDERKRIIGPPPMRNMATGTTARPPVQRKPVAQVAPKPAAPKLPGYGKTANEVEARVARLHADGPGDEVRNRARAMLHPYQPTIGEVSIANVSPQRLRQLLNSLDGRNGPTGGYAVGQIELSELFAIVRVGASPFRSAGCTVLTQEASIAALIAQCDIGANEATVVAQGAAPNTPDMTFSAHRVPFFKLGGGPTLVPFEYLRDAPNADDMIVTSQALLLARGEGHSLTLGTATRQGVVDLAPVTVTAQGDALASDDVYSLLGSIETEYGDAPAAGFMMHRLVYTAMRKVKDASGQPVFRGPWGTLAGRRVNFNRWMASSLTSGSKPVLYGDWSQFAIVDVNKPRISRFIDALGVIDNDLVAIQSFCELDAALLNPSTIYPAIVALQMP